MTKKAVVIGGSNGIGLALSKQLIEQGYQVVILDKEIPDMVCDSRITFLKCNLLNINFSLFEELAEDPNVNLLMITAGIGRVASLDDLSVPEIEKTFEINSIATIKILKQFYHRIQQEKPFYCGVMGSISGFVSSPLFSVYAASKAAVCRFVESVNIELEMSGTKNRILNVSPGSIKGTRFNGGENNPALTESLACDILSKLFQREAVFIPEYEEVYKGVIQRYYEDPHEYGVHSYSYKLRSGRLTGKKKICVGYLSGTFDLFHVGHLNLLRRAKDQCDYLIVGVHPDASHKNKETFISFEERKEIVGACKYVDRVVQSFPEDSDAWEDFQYDKLFVGSDYKGSERFNRYEQFFADKNVTITYFPYTKETNSTQIREKIKSRK